MNDGMPVDEVHTRPVRHSARLQNRSAHGQCLRPRANTCVDWENGDQRSLIRCHGSSHCCFSDCYDDCLTHTLTMPRCVDYSFRNSLIDTGIFAMRTPVMGLVGNGDDLCVCNYHGCDKVVG